MKYYSKSCLCFGAELTGTAVGVWEKEQRGKDTALGDLVVWETGFSSFTSGLLPDKKSVLHRQLESRVHFAGRPCPEAVLG